MDEELNRPQSEAAGDAEIDQLLRSRPELDPALRRHKALFAVLFTDIVSSTAFFERFGDTAGLRMLERHNQLVLPAIEGAGGNVIKTIGDAVLAVFASPAAAVRTAIEIQRRLDDDNQERSPNDHIYTRIGVNFGRGFVKEGDVYGDLVNVAARVVKACAPAQILLTRPVADALPSEEAFDCRKLQAAPLRGKAAPEQLYEVLWTSPERYLQVRRRLDQRASSAPRQTLGRYEILEELGRGAMGIVYKAYDPVLDRLLALKTVQVTATGKERQELVRRLRQEAQAAGRLDHPNLITVFDAGETAGLCYIAMQFIKGPTLAQLMKDRPLLPLPQILALFDQVCEGLHYAHERGIVHRDLKPSNLLITREGQAKIVDFGIAKLVESSHTTTGLILGTPSYMSPEQAQGTRLDRRSDIFSLGAILYELFSGEKAFPGNNPTAILYKILHADPIPLRTLTPSLDPALDRIVRKALAKDPFRRYQTCQELQRDVKAFSQPRPAPAPLPSPARAPAPRPQPPPQPQPRPARSGGRIVFLLLLLALAGAWGWQQDVLSSWSTLLQPPPIPPALPTSPAPPGSLPDVAPKPAEPSPSPATQESASEPKTPAQPRPRVTQPPPQEKPPARPTRPRLSPEQQRELEQWLALAQRYDARGQYQQAIVALEKALEIDPENKPAQEMLEEVREKQALRGPPNP
ncbi:MAG: protein kinase [Terriglobia bacterium]